MWIAEINLAGWGALGTGIAALLTATGALFKVKQHPGRKVESAFRQIESAVKMVDELQEENDRVRKHLVEVEGKLWSLAEQHEECKTRLASLERRINSQRPSSRRRVDPG